MREEIVRYQKEAVDVLYAWAQTPRAVTAPKQGLVPSEPVVAPRRPAPDASLAEWRDFYVRMAAVIEWQMEVDQWQRGKSPGGPGGDDPPHP